MDPIDGYLDELSHRLRLTPAATRRLLAETEAHLRDAVEDRVARGATVADAETSALASFGTPRQVARAANGGPVELVGAGVLAGAQLVAVGSAAVIAGTVLAELLAKVTATGWVFGPRAGFAPSRAQVAHWLQLHPGARGWRAAAAAENASDSLVLRGSAAVLALLAGLAVLMILRRRFRRIGAGVVPAVGATAFGGAAVLLTVTAATGSVALADWGSGQAWCDAAVAAILAIAYLARGLRAVVVTS